MVRFFSIPVNESTLLSRDLDPLDDATLLFALLARDDLADAAESSDNPRALAPCALAGGDNGIALWRGENREPPMAAPFRSRTAVFRPVRVASPAASWCTTDAWRI